MVTLINTTKQMKVYNLDHPYFRTKKWGARKMAVTVTVRHRDGALYPKTERRTVVGSMTLLAGEERKGLPPQIQAVPEIRKAIRLGILRVEKEAPPKEKKRPAPARPKRSEKKED